MIGPVNNGGIGTFAFHFAKLLREAGYPVLMVFTSAYMHPERNWAHIYTDLDIRYMQINGWDDGLTGHGYEWFVKRSRAVAAALPDDIEVVYFQDWQADGFHLTRRNRFTAANSPTCVTVLHSSTEWIRDGMQWLPAHGYDDLHISFAEGYTAGNSDFVASPSRYMVDYVSSHGWHLPPDEHVQVMGYPFQIDTPENPQTIRHAEKFGRLVFFGRLETRKGLEVFVEAVAALARNNNTDLAHIREVVFVGKQEGHHRFGDIPTASAYMQSAGLRADVRVEGNFSQPQALAYLASVAPDALVVIPSLVDNFPFTVIETSNIPGLNMICSSAGGIPEILGQGGAHQLFDPNPDSLKRKLAEFLAHGLYAHDELGHYDVNAGNKRWLAFHRTVAGYNRTLPDVNLAAQVDICVCGNQLSEMRHTLHALTLQTHAPFTVTAVFRENDAPDIAAQYPNWRFIQGEGGAGHLRNTATANRTADYLLFIGGDHIPTPGMIFQLIEAIQISGDDCLTAYSWGIDHDDFSYTVGDGVQHTRPPVSVRTPPGNMIAGGIVTNVWGSGVILVRREVFAAVGGFNALPDMHLPDYELLARLALNGYALDVLPEYLHYHPHPDVNWQDMRLHFRDRMHVMALYREKLHGMGLAKLPEVFNGLDWRLQHFYFSGTKDGRFVDDETWIATRVDWRVVYRALFMKLALTLTGSAGNENDPTTITAAELARGASLRNLFRSFVTKLKNRLARK